jgi:hypothetical protein
MLIIRGHGNNSFFSGYFLLLGVYFRFIQLKKDDFLGGLGSLIGSIACTVLTGILISPFSALSSVKENNDYFFTLGILEGSSFCCYYYISSSCSFYSITNESILVITLECYIVYYFIYIPANYLSQC